MCGFIHSTFLTVPVTLMGLDVSNWAASEWCANAGTLLSSSPATITKEANETDFIEIPPYFFCASDSLHFPPPHRSFSRQTYSSRFHVECSTISKCSVHGLVQILG